jgi:CubicO group peptidase (beta-lactamase class C family)
MKRTIATICFLAASSLGAAADEADDYIGAQMRRRHIPGLSLAVIRDGKVVKAQGYGLANVETGTPATPETVYKIASLSKQFLAAGILLLERDGKLGLDDRADKYLDGAPGAWSDITIRHLLTHTSGLDEDPPDFEPFKVRPDADVVRSAYSAKLLFAPGERWSYSNLGYFVLGEVIRKAAGKPYDQFLAERIFAPAGMAATRTTTTTGIVPSRASGYSWRNRGLRNAEDWVAVRPSGAFLSTVLDMASWDTTLDSGAILPASSCERMWEPVRLKDGHDAPYGFGWRVDSWQGHRRVHHGGGLPGFQSDYERFVDDKLTVVVMMNSESGDPSKIALHLAGFYVPALAPPVPMPIEDTEPEVTSKVKAFIAGLVEGDPDLGLVSPRIADRLKSGGIAGLSAAFRDPGPIQSVALVERKDRGDGRSYRYRVTYRDDSLLAIFLLDKESKITGLGIEPE